MKQRNAVGGLLAAIMLLYATPGGVCAETIQLQSEALVVEIAVEDAGLRDRYGPRFDEMARVRSVRRDGREYLHPNGLCDEFGILGLGVLGYEDVEPGESFIKIGLGLLERTDQRRYLFSRSYPMVSAFPVTVERAEGSLTVTQRSPALKGYGYLHTKTYRVDDATLSIEYTLENTGDLAFSFDHYNHNWFQFDERPVDRDIYIEPMFSLPELPFTWLEKDGRQWRFSAPVLDDDARYFPLFHAIPHALAGVTLGHHQTGQRVRLGGDFPLARFALYVEKTAICPERFVRRRVAPGETTQWRRTYRFE